MGFKLAPRPLRNWRWKAARFLMHCGMFILLDGGVK